MRRRDVLAGLAVVASAGCTGSPAVGSGTTTGATTTPRPSVGDTSFEVTDTGCGTGKESASVTVTEETVVVAGTTSAPNGCYTAELEAARYDADANELRVVVAAVEREDVESCVQCITEIDYEASVAFDNGLPERVVVVHRSRGEEREVATKTSL